MIISPKQIKMAQAGLGWSTVTLSEKTGLHKNTLNSINKDGASTREATLNLLKATFEANGITFIENNGVIINSKDA